MLAQTANHKTLKPVITRSIKPEWMKLFLLLEKGFDTKCSEHCQPCINYEKLDCIQLFRHILIYIYSLQRGVRATLSLVLQIIKVPNVYKEKRV